uniref:C2H2-type domain-containing protein n=1 Tax=viral metagenome TaxID=1070528 RepID=A0A6C0HJF7_9ZZZZ
MNDNGKMPKNAKIFWCENCDFKCSKQSNYNAHILTRKHQRITDDNEKMPKNAKKCQSTLSCQCGKLYQFMSGLSRHKKTCKIIQISEQNSSEISIDSLTNAVVSPYTNTHIIVPPYNPHPEIQPSESTKLILELMRDNQEFKNLLIEQNKIMLEIVQKTQSMATYNANGAINSNNSNNNSHNKQFNIQFFLNEQCKNAINLSDFVENLQLNFDDLENVADKGYVEGITQIFMNGLKELDIYTRPVHCTDVKRETVHVRENNIWIRDTPDQCKIKAAIRRIAFRNVQQISKWNKEHPDYKILDSNDFKRSFQIMKQSLGNTIPGGVEKNNGKIAKNLLQFCAVKTPVMEVMTGRMD